ncbi:SDR family NAD(P)-dependent oxidoreductase [Luteimonas sp. FCS-9]|uniref:SDR family NAD(P)-dependent oxidoreductase n=1 Tax=Luteimonas sp. FCS-9 TaxID=1547516 RepID=UPI000A5E0601|nr:SDR family NAD(P)-dependent oxidoreductase [Luteimonas sp. FCS-9]
MSSVLITGGHTGIGLECSRQLAARGFDIVLAGRSPERMDVVAEELRAAHRVRVFTVTTDTSSLASIRQAAAQVRAWFDAAELGTLSAIICNAGISGTSPVSHSVDGYELTFATNCLGHFLLLHLLIDLLAENGRVVFTASGTHDPETGDGRFGSAVHPDAKALASQGKDGKPVIAAQSRYSTSKLCTILYAYELDRRFRRSGSAMASIAFDPGGISESAFARGLPKPVQAIIRSRLVKWLMKRAGVNVGSLAVAGEALARLAVDEAFASGSGKYFQADERGFRERRSSTLSYDRVLAETLWNDSRVLVRLQESEEFHAPR